MRENPKAGRTPLKALELGFQYYFSILIIMNICVANLSLCVGIKFS
jgi:hypothetical protein